MKRIIAVMTLVIVLALGTGVAHATQGHFSPGASGIMGATLPPPGTYIKVYNTFVDAGSLRSDSGKKLADAETDIYVLTARFINTFDEEIFGGGNPILDISVPANYIQQGSAVSPTGEDRDKLSLGDTLVQFLIAWHGERWDAVIGPGIYVPIGSKSEMGAGKEYYSWLFGGGMTHYFDVEKSLHFSWLARIEGHFKNEADRTPGYAVHGEFGLGKRVAPNLTIGVAANAYKQIGSDTGSRGTGPYDRDDLYQGYAVGPEVQYVTQSGLAIELRYFWQFEVKNGTQGNSFFLNFTKAL